MTYQYEEYHSVKEVALMMREMELFEMKEQKKGAEQEVFVNEMI